MSTSPWIEAAQALLNPSSQPWLEPTRCRDVVACLHAEGEHDLAAELEAASSKPLGWPGGTTVA